MDQSLANWMLAYNEECGRPHSLKIPVEKRALAHLLGMRPENLSRSFAELAALGVEAQGPTIKIRNLAALTEFAKPDPLVGMQRQPASSRRRQSKRRP